MKPIEHPRTPWQRFRVPLLALSLAIAGMALIGYMYRTGPQAKELVWHEHAERTAVNVPLTVEAHEYYTPTIYAMDMWNDQLGCEVFKLGGNDVAIRSDDGAPCGDPWRPNDEEGHSATAYWCGISTWEIYVSMPGDTRTQLCIIAHELGHVLGLADDGSHNLMVMNQFYCPEVDEGIVRVSDKDRAALQKRYCNP